MTAILHVYAQEFPHAAVLVVGNQEGLAVLGGAIYAALDDGVNTESTEVFVRDGEGYKVMVRLLKNAPMGSHHWQGLALPYTSPSASDKGEPA